MSLIAFAWRNQLYGRCARDSGRFLNDSSGGFCARLPLESGRFSTRMKRLIVPSAEREEIWRVSRLQTVIWATSAGVRCVVARYDETRYQLRLLRGEETIKADLFASVADASRTAHRWRAELIARDSGEWPQQSVSEEDRWEHGAAAAHSVSPCASDTSEHKSVQRRRARVAARNPAKERPR